MRLVTLNTWKNEGDYSRRLALMRDGLAALAPDVICLQECFACEGDDTAAWLGRELGLTVHAAPMRAKPRLHGGQARFSTSGLAILCRDNCAWDACDLPSSAADGGRRAQWLDLADGVRPLRVLNLHLTHLRGPGSGELRAAQLAHALKRASESLSGGLVVAGDLNAPADAPALSPIAGGPRLELPTLIGERAQNPPRSGPAIDHCVLARAGGWRVKRLFRALDGADADGRHASDHAAVVLDLA